MWFWKVAGHMKTWHTVEWIANSLHKFDLKSFVPNIFPPFVEGHTRGESETFKIVIGYLFGAAASVSLVGIAKFTIGRLRPHFLDVCQPDFSQIDCGTADHPIFVTEYHCKVGLSICTQWEKWLNSMTFFSIFRILEMNSLEVLKSVLFLAIRLLLFKPRPFWYSTYKPRLYLIAKRIWVSFWLESL